ncbi:MAG: helix-turn-helix domain-containing protein [Candidatus Moraniibacteriota bacterium]
MYNEQLEQFGLSKAQAQVYMYLLEHGGQKAGEIARGVTIKRGLVYKALKELESMTLIERRDEPNKPDIFLARHPEMLRNHIEERLRRAKEAEVLFTSFAPALGSAFNLISGKPGIRVLEGFDGFKTLYKDIIAEGKSIKLIRSSYDRENPEIAKFIDKQIHEQIRHEINVKLLTHETPNAAQFALWSDDDRLVTRRIVTDPNFLLPAQFVLYGNKVGITDFETTFITTIIENIAIRKSFDIMFDYMWRAAKAGHDKLLAQAEKDQNEKKGYSKAK